MNRQPYIGQNMQIAWVDFYVKMNNKMDIVLIININA